MKPVLYLLLFFSSLFAAACSSDEPFEKEEPQGESAYVTKLFDYCPAPGQFINTALFGQKEAAEALLNGGSAILTLGAWGGFVVYGFDHMVKNHAGAADFCVLGNAFEGSSEAGIIYVMHDTNGDGLPNDTWYELKGSEYGTANYTKSRTVTYFRPDNDTCSVYWEDSSGQRDTMRFTRINFPDWVEGHSLTITAPHLTVSINAQNLWGYADTFLPTGMGDMDIDNAIDRDGNAVHLPGIHFVKIQTGSLQDLGILKEFSTEVTCIKDLHFEVKGFSN